MAHIDRQNLSPGYHLCSNSDTTSICIVCDEIRQLELEIKETKDHLLALNGRRRGLASKFNTTHDPITQKLPVELISKIFMIYTPDYAIRRTKIALSLGWICRAWREIAWSTPRLWMFCAVNVFGKEDPRVRHDGVDVVKQWLERSGTLPLAIMLFNSRLPIPDSDLTESYNIIEVINQYSGRWSSLDIRLSSQLIFRLKGVSNDSSTLRALRIGVRIPEENTTTGMLFQLQVKPSPADVVLWYIRLKHIDIFWNFVVKIILRDSRLDEFLEIIARAPRLISCELTGLYQAGEDYPFPQTIIAHSSIRKLTISGSSQSQITQLLDRVSFPALREIFFVNEMVPVPTESMVSLSTRSHCQLTSLVLQHIFETDDIIRLLHQTPALKQLRLLSISPIGPDTDCVNTIFDLISKSASIKPGERGSFLPKLEILAVIAPRTFSWKSVAFLADHNQCDTIESETQDIGYRRPFKSLILSLELDQGQTYYIDKEDIPGLFRLIQQGISLEIFKTLKGPQSERGDLLKLSIEFHSLSP